MRFSIILIGIVLLVLGFLLPVGSLLSPFVGGPIPPCIPNVNCPVSTTSSVSSGTTTYYYTTTNPYAGCIGPQSTNPTCTASSLQTQTSSSVVTSSSSPTVTTISTTVTPTSTTSPYGVILNIVGFATIIVGALLPGSKSGMTRG